MPGGVATQFCAQVPLPYNATTDLFFNPILGEFSKNKPALVQGGMICEQMGLGKTIISLALILSNPAPALPLSGSPTKNLAKAPKPVNGQPFWNPKTTVPQNAGHAEERGSILSRGTLVICPVSLVTQWIDEAKSKLENPGLVYSYHGSNRSRDPTQLAANSIIVTTYHTLASDHTRMNNNGCPPLEQIRWWRVICDESHAKDREKDRDSLISCRRQQVGCFRYVFQTVNHGYVFFLSRTSREPGTPMSSSITDLKGQLEFLGIDRAKSLVSRLLQHGGSKVNDKSVQKSRHCSSFRQSVGLFTFHMRPIMMRHSQGMKYAGTDTTLMSLPPKTEEVMMIDFTAIEKREYVKLEQNALCFYQSFDRRKIGKAYLELTSSLLPMRLACAGGQIPLDATNDDEQESEVSELLSTHAFKSKLKRLVTELNKIRETEPGSKTLVFSQFRSTLEWLKQELPKHGYQFRTLSGNQSLTQRAKALRDFQNDPPTTLFLLSMR